MSPTYTVVDELHVWEIVNQLVDLSLSFTIKKKKNNLVMKYSIGT